MRRRWAAAMCVVAAVAAVPAAAQALGSTGSTPVHVWPPTGGVHSRFGLRFSIPTTTGMYRTDSIYVPGQNRPWCTGSTTIALPPATAGHTFRVTMSPPAHSRWCAGTYTGVLMQRQRVVCDPGPVVMDPRRPAATMCPQIMFPAQTLGQFRFRVVR